MCSVMFFLNVSLAQYIHTLRRMSTLSREVFICEQQLVISSPFYKMSLYGVKDRKLLKMYLV